ncbi:MAG: molecular chaperone DnaJ, partial [Candidatus Falkowbacteria bacterium]|nr:molecular chaperone DnaJ [Candidatus Falkowbacteria bacterium]
EGSTTLTIPNGTQSCTEFRLRSYGVPHLNKKTRGDHIVKVIVKTPTKLSRKEKDLYRELTEVS